VRECFEGLLDLFNLVKEASIRLPLLIQHTLDLKHRLLDLRVMLVTQMTRGRFPTAALNQVEGGPRYLWLENLLREVLNGGAVDGLRWGTDIPLVLHDVYNGCPTEVKYESLMLINLLRCLKDASGLSCGHGGLVRHRLLVEGVLEGPSEDLGQIPCRVVLRQTVQGVHTVEATGALSPIRPNVCLGAVMLRLTVVLLYGPHATPELLM
jgi:hypothetical protein